MPILFNDTPADQLALETIAAYLTRGQRTAAAKQPPTGSAENGRVMFAKSGCAACHEPPEDVPTTPLRIPSLDKLSDKWTARGLAAFLRNPLQTRPHGRMPDFAFSLTEANDVAAYLLTRPPGQLAPSFLDLSEAQRGRTPPPERHRRPDRPRPADAHERQAGANHRSLRQRSPWKSERQPRLRPTRQSQNRTRLRRIRRRHPPFGIPMASTSKPTSPGRHGSRQRPAAPSSPKHRPKDRGPKAAKRSSSPMGNPPSTSAGSASSPPTRRSTTTNGITWP